jgi:hypothetical protein
MAKTVNARHDRGVPAWNAYSYVFGPLLAFGGLGLLILLLRWAFRRGVSVVAAPGKRGAPDEYGMLVPVASPATYIEGEIMRRHLESDGIRSNLAHTVDGPRVLVWPADVDRAKVALSQPR